MRTAKVIRDFSSARYSDPELSFKSSHVLAQMTGNPVFINPNPPLSALEEAIISYNMALKDVEGGSKVDTVVKNDRRKFLENILQRETDYVQQVSGGEEAIILSSGFDVKRKPALIGPLPKAMGLFLRTGENKGAIIANCNRVSNARFYEFEYTEMPVTANSFWQKRTSTKHKILIDGLTSGKQYTFRVAGAGSDPSRNWSDEMSSFVL